MNKDKQTIEESLNKIKFMMNYDSSKTLIENKKSIYEQESPDFRDTAGGLLTRPILGWPKYVNSLQSNNTSEDAPSNVDEGSCENAIEMAEVESKLTQVANTVKKMNTAFLRMAKGESRAKLIYRNLKSLVGHNVYNEDFNECKSVEETINEIWPMLFRDWFSKGESLEEELQQLIDSNYYRDGAIIQKYLKASIKLLHSPVKPNTVIPPTTSAPPLTTGGYKPVQGTNEDPYKFGTSGAGIFKVQECLGDLVTDGKFGPKTQAKMGELAKQYVNEFTDADIDTICKLANPRRDSTPVDTNPVTNPITKANTDTNYTPKPRPIKMADFAPKLDNKLRPSSLKPVTSGVTT